MSRLPFDPGKISGPPKPGTAGERPLTVSQLGAMIDGALREAMPKRVRVIGEVSAFNERTHWYFSLKDAGAVVSCVMFAAGARAVPFKPVPGQEVVATGRIEYFAKQGRTQFYVEKLEPVGAGALDLEFKRLCDRVRTLGWFAPERKRPLPAFPRRIAVITSKTGAALQDVLHTMQRRCPSVGVLLVDVRVQGGSAARAVARALSYISLHHAALGVDAVLVTRGGGSKEDLWAFNDFDLARAIVECSIPVVAAIGHETDTTIAELVADERCSTPTQAAVRLTPDTGALAEQLGSRASGLISSMRRVVRQQSRRVEAASQRQVFVEPASLTVHARTRLAQSLRLLRGAVRARVQDAASRLEHASARLEAHRPATLYTRRHDTLFRAETGLVAAMRGALARVNLLEKSRGLHAGMNRALERCSMVVDSHERAIQLVGPAAVLGRGYSCTLRADGTWVRSVRDVQPGDHIKTVVVDGSFQSVVGAGAPGRSTLPVAAPRRPGAASLPKRSGRRPPPRRDQLDLFGGGG